MSCNKSIMTQKIIERDKGLDFIILTTPVFKVEYLLILDHKSFQIV